MQTMTSTTKQQTRPAIGQRVCYIDTSTVFEGEVIAHSDLNSIVIRLDKDYRKYGNDLIVYGFNLKYITVTSKVKVNDNDS